MSKKRYHNLSFADKDSVYLLVGDYRLQVSDFTAAFAINEIPQAVVTVAVGYNARTLEPAPVYAILDALDPSTAAQVVMTVNADTPELAGLNGQEIVLFEGRFKAFGRQKSFGSAKFAVFLSHWLQDLSFSNAVTALGPQSASPMRMPAILPQNLAGAGAGQKPVFAPESYGYDKAFADVGTDLWKAVHAYLSALASVEGFVPNGPPLLQLAVGKIKMNAQAFAALKRIEAPGGGDQLPYSAGNGPLGLRVSSGELNAALAREICKASTPQMLQQSLWDVLIGYYCPYFMLNLLPRIESAVVSGSLPAGPAQRTLKANEYRIADFGANFARPLRAVVCYGHFAMDTNPGMSAPASEGPITAGGVYIGDVAAGFGTILYQNLPPWMPKIITEAAGGNPVGNGNQPTSTAQNPGQGTAAPPADSLNLQKMADKYAETLYHLHRYQGRRLNLSCPFRLDVGPGTIVAIEDQDEGNKVTYTGQVQRVTLVVSRSAKQASTVLDLNHVTTGGESRIDSHPLYAKVVTDMRLR